MDVKEFVDHCWDLTEEYIVGVKDETIKTNKWIKLAVKRFEDDVKRDDLDYRTDKVDKVYKFFYFMNINKNNKYTRFDPLPFQAFIIAALFGFYWKGTSKRKYRYSFLMLARKNGKSVFASALQLYFLVADGVEDPQSLLLASTREQASICLDYATGIINNSPALRKRLEAQRYKILFKDKNKGGFSKVLASNSNKLDGYSASGAILDEVHAYPDEKLFNVIKSSVLARENPMIFLITTAGFSLTSFCYNYMTYARNVLTGDIIDDTLFAALYTLDEEDDPSDEENWIKSNPALGEIAKMDDLKAEFNQSIFSRNQQDNFLTKHLNVFVEQASSWIPNEQLVKVFDYDLDITKLYGADCYIGMDLSAIRDLSNVSCLLVKDNHFYVVPFFYMANNAAGFLRSGGVNLKDWIDNKDIILCDTPTIDYDLIVEKFVEISKNFNIRLATYDPFNSSGIITSLFKEGMPMQAFAQRTLNFNEPIKFMTKLIYNNDNITLTNPVLKWNLNNVVIFRDGNGNEKIMKNKSLDSVDGAVATAMAFGAYQQINQGANLDSNLWE